MDTPIVVITDNVCTNSNENENVLLKKKKRKYFIKEAVSNRKVVNNPKKVRLPTLVNTKKCAKIIFKKAGLHPIGIFHLMKIIFIVSLINTAGSKVVCAYTSTSFDPPSVTPPPPPPTSIPPPAVTATSPLSWARGSPSNNKMIRMINGNGRKGYNIGLWNCRRGLIIGEKNESTKLVEIKQFLEKKSLHLLCLVESDLHSPISRYIRRNCLSTEDVHRVLGISGYKIILPKSWQVHGQARVMVFVKEELNVNIRDNGISNADLPTITCEISFGRERKTIVNFCYREFTSGVSGLSDMNSQVERWSRQLRIWNILLSGTKDVICMGDTNLCSQRWLEDDYKNKELSDMTHTFMLETACSQLVKENTRSEVAQGGIISTSCIDHCYTNSPEKVSDPEVVAVGSSDHLGVVVRKFSKVARSNPNTVKKRSYRDFKVEEFLKEVIESDINRAVMGCNDVDDAAVVFQEKFKNILDKHAPIKIFQMRKNYNPYLKEETKLLIEERAVLKEEMTRNGDKALAKEIKQKSKDIVKAINNDKKVYFEEGLSDKVDVSTAWKTANELLGNKKNLAPTVIKVVGKDGNTETVTNPQKLATMFNQFFRRKVQLLRNKTNQPPKTPPTARLRQWLETRGQPPPPFSLKEIDKKTFRMIMKKMKGKRVHGCDWIDSYSLKIASPILEESLMHLVNLSIRQRKFAVVWKPQLIHPVHKKKAKDEIENFRPVSHLVQVGKIAEYAVNFQIIDHFVKHDLFHPNHHGSLANHSTATAVIQLFDLWLEAAQRHELSAVCLLDQSAAYDLLCHQILGDKLKLYNFDEASVAWVMSYLGGRTQQVQIESKISASLDCEDHAVPQGSVLGGLLHVINSNDFPACHEVGEAVVYVDDDSDTVHSADPVQLQNLIHQEAGNSASWLNDNRLCVAGEKSKLLIIGTKQLRNQKLFQKIKINVEGKEIIETDSEKLLGVVINNELTWKNHLHGDEEHQGLIPQLSTRLGILKKLSSRMSRERLKMFASGIFYSKLSYCLPVYGNVFGLEKYKEENSRYTSFTISDNSKLQVLQNKMNRLLTGADKYTSTADLLVRTNSLSIQQMIAFQTIMMTYKIMKTKKPTYLSNKLIKKNHQLYLRGAAQNLIQPKKSLSICKEGFIRRGITLMNMLSDSLRNEPDQEQFKVQLREWIKSNIAIKPSPKFQVFGREGTRPAAPPAPPAPTGQGLTAHLARNPITNYFQRLNRN